MNVEDILNLQSKDLSYGLYVLVDALIAIFFGISIGFFLDLLFPYPHSKENGFLLIFILILQLLITSLIMFYYSAIYKHLFNVDPDKYLCFTMFSIILFLSQSQMTYRLSLFYTMITGKSFDK